MKHIERAATHIGPGGYKCPCCGPAPAERQKFRRVVRRRMKQAFAKLVRSELKEG